MTSFQKKIMNAFDRLAPDRQAVLELLSVAYRPMSRTRAMNLVVEAGIKNGDGKRFYPKEWKSLVDRLLKKQLLAKVEREIVVRPQVIELITRRAEAGGRLDRWDAAASPKQVFSWGRFYERPSDLLAAIRIAAHRNDGEMFLNLLGDWYEQFGGHDWVETFDSPFDREWMMSRVPAIRDPSLDLVVTRAHASLAPADEAIELVKELIVTHAGDPDVTSLSEHYAIAGRVSDARAWLHPEDFVARETMEGWLHFLEGDDAQAIRSFESAIARFKKKTRKRKIALQETGGIFYPLALLRSAGIDRLDEVRAWADAAHQDAQNSHHNLYAFLLYVVDALEGKPDATRSLAAYVDHINRMYPLDAFFYLIVLFWVDRTTCRKQVKEIERLRKTAAAGGYQWVVDTCDTLVERLNQRVPRRAANPASGQHPSILDVVRETAPWELSLSALERVGAQRPSVDKPARTSRLVWRVSLNRGWIDVTPVEQRMSKAGKWSKGRAIALKRLHGSKRPDFVTDHDVRVCEAIEVEGTGGYRYGGLHYYLDSGRALSLLAGHPAVYRAEDPNIRLDVVLEDPALKVTDRGSHVHVALVPAPPPDGQERIIREVSESRLVVTDFEKRHRDILETIGPEGLEVPAEAKDRVIRAVSAVSELVTVHSNVAGADTETPAVDAVSTPHLHLTPFGHGLRVEPLVRPFGASGPTERPGAGGEVLFSTVDDQRSSARRDLEEEKALLDAVVVDCPCLSPGRFDGVAWVLSDPSDCLELLVELEALEDRVVVAWPEGESMKIRDHAHPDQLSLKVRRQRDWFAIDGSLTLDSGLVLKLKDLLSRHDEGVGRFLALGKGEFVALSERFRRHLMALEAYSEETAKGLRFHPARTAAFEGLIEEAGEADADAAWSARLKAFKDAQSIEPEVPTTLQATLRDYQEEGFRWASRLAAWGAGACLADDMGLGKTIQALAVALDRAPDGPALVVAPTSVCANWMDEARRYTPTLRPIPFGTKDRVETIKGLGAFDLLVCSYGLLHQEASRLAEVDWETIVLDEAQAIKNRGTMRSKAAMKLKGGFKMITTGTPLENHLGELWNLFQFTNPGLLGSLKSFNTAFASPIQEHDSEEKKAQLRRLIQPFILRRTKAAVLDELPPRTEITIRVDMSDEERALYEAVRSRAVEDLEGEDPNPVQILAEITKLRRACCHPRLVVEDSKATSSKHEAVLETVDDLLDNGHKALVFSQFVSHLAILREALDARGIDYRYLDGSTPAKERKRQVDAFQSGEGELFLISLRAGGQGLNLTAADYVLHLDPWWNPAVEDQASDRAHRIGQDRPVTVYRFVMKDTIEEKIVDLHGEKRDLADSLLEGADMSGKLSAAELLELMRGD